MRSSWLASVAAIGAAGLLAACSTDATSTASSSATTTTTAAVADIDGEYTDDQLRAFITARRDVDRLNRNFAQQTPEQQAQTTAQIQTAIAQHQINPATYAAIQRLTTTDQAFAQRVTQLQVATVTDAQLRAFVAASREIQPLTANISTATEAQRAEIATQIGAILDRNNVDSSLYNALAVEAQSNQALAARISAAAGQTTGTPEG